ncbi:MAG: hypothetical protein EA385_07735 [Salinarimonadaceae bacterium]|nr:MAG: hypothetical protein EA385_07735 [Salinarimonadaceae bacterium]
MTQINDRIAQIEEAMAFLRDRAENCRKIMVLSRIVIVAGATALAAFFLGLMRFDGLVFMGAVTAILVALVTLGSNKSTRDQLLADIARKAAERDALIDAIAPRAVETPARIGNVAPLRRATD